MSQSSFNIHVQLLTGIPGISWLSSKEFRSEKTYSATPDDGCCTLLYLLCMQDHWSKSSWLIGINSYQYYQSNKSKKIHLINYASIMLSGFSIPIICSKLCQHTKAYSIWSVCLSQFVSSLVII